MKLQKIAKNLIMIISTSTKNSKPQNIITHFLSILLLFSGALHAQVSFSKFNVAPPNLLIGTPFENVSNSSNAWADIDGDNDQDLLISGINSSNQKITKLYTNNGFGEFTLVTGTPFDGIDEGSIAFADIDGDNDQDVLITGANSTSKIAKLYTNNGSGVFVEVIGTPFDGTWRGAVAFTDVDGDNDQDVLITGITNSGSIAKLYKNNGFGIFTEELGTPFDPVAVSAIAFEDIDGDNDPDLIITGSNSTNNRIAKLYTNNGSGSFTEVPNTSLLGVRFGSVSFADIDGDNDQDLFISGQSSNGLRSKLYTNNGSGVFTLVTGTPFKGVYRNSCKFADIDGDNDLDLILTGSNSTNWTKLYTNDGTGTFTEIVNTPFIAVEHSSVSFEDVDNDNDPDLLITGLTNSYKPITKLYSNNGQGVFMEVTGTPFDGVNYSDIEFADVDGDNDQDVLITGKNSANLPTTTLYTNNGIGVFTETSDAVFIDISNGAIAFSDIDGDNDQDVLITGRDIHNYKKANLFINNGTGSFTKLTGTPFSGVFQSAIEFADVDGDNDEDVLITGINSANQPITKLYTNNGLGSFTEVAGTSFENVSHGSIKFADIDGDSDQDLLITGINSTYVSVTNLYINNGAGAFTLANGTPFTGVSDSSIDFADIDGDNDQDLIITGRIVTNPAITKLYTNDGLGVFTEVIGTPFTGVRNSSIGFIDVDNDNDQDILITGSHTGNTRIAKLYLNNGRGQFTEEIGTPFDAIEIGSIAFADIDNDNDQDILITGSDTSNQLISLGYQNNMFSPCIPTSSTYTVTACDSFKFNQVTYTSNNTTATDTVQNTAGCDSIITLNLTINTVDVSLTITLQTTIRANASGAQYQWLNCDNSYMPIPGETNQNFTATANGHYAVEVNNGLCIDTSNCVEVTGVGISEINLENSIHTYPNPTSDNVTIDFGNAEYAKLLVTNIMGDIIYNTTNSNNRKLTISLAKYPAGIYLFEIQYNNQKRIIRVVKE